MEYLHKHKEEFINAVNLASEYFHILPVIVEKDYYVTMILRELTERTIEGFIECDLREKSLMTMRKKSGPPVQRVVCSRAISPCY